MVKNLSVLILVFSPTLALALGISGSFVQINDHMVPYTQSQWEQEISLMKQAGFDTVIIQSTIHEGKAYYPSSLPFVTSITDDVLSKILLACQNNNIKCYVGLISDNRWWTSIGKQAVLSNLGQNNIAAADELLPICSQYASFVGWYIVEEINAQVWSSPVGYYQRMLIDELFDPLIGHLKAITPDKKISTAPYVYDTNYNKDTFYDWWNYFLTNVDFDIVMLQDGSSADDQRKIQDILPYYEKLGQICESENIEFWSDLEVFDRIEYSSKKYYEVKVQIASEKKYVDKMVAFEWFYITPTQETRCSLKTDPYQQFYVNMAADNKDYSFVSLNKDYTINRQPSSSYPDSIHELTDSQVAFDMVHQLGFNELTPNVQPSVVIDLRENIYAEYGFSAVVMNRPTWGVVLPEKIEVAVSQDGINFEYVSDLTVFPVVSEDSLNVYFAFPSQAIHARYVKFTTSNQQWFMCCEMSVYRRPSVGDYNDDGKVDLYDFYEFVNGWLSCDSSEPLLLENYAGLASNWGWKQDQKEYFRKKFHTVKNVQLSQSSPYLNNRSVESIVSEIEVNGFDSIFLMAPSSQGIQDGIVDMLHERDIAVGLMLFASSVYTPTSDFPANWQDWKMEWVNNENPCLHMSFIHDGYRQWMKQRAVDLCNTYDFDAITFAEPIYPCYDGVTEDPVVYTDVSPAYQAIFKVDTGETAFPNFTDPADPDYFKTNTVLYQKLVQHRIDSITNFFDEIVNGNNGLRELAPNTLVVTWSLACSKLEKSGVDVLPEWEGNDARAIVRKVKPDMHYCQSHWPDWADPSLPSDYTFSYMDNYREVWEIAPRIPVGVQADIHSLDTSKRSNQWYSEFLDTCNASNLSSSTYYCFSLRSDVYDAAPEFARAKIDKISTLDSSGNWLNAADVNKTVSASGDLLLRIWAKDKSIANWFFISEIKVNSESEFTYTISPQTPPYAGRPDNCNDLNNEIVASNDLSDVDWVEWAPDAQGSQCAYADITLHLPAGLEIKNISIHVMNKEVSNIHMPASIEIEGVEFALDTSEIINLEFNQVLHDDAASIAVQRTLADSSGEIYNIVSAAVDGSILKLELDRNLPSDDYLTLDISGMSDDPGKRWVTNAIAPGPRNYIPDGTVITFQVK